MRFIDEPCTRPSNGHTRGVLSISTSRALACRPFAWFTSSIAVFLFPLLLLWITTSRNLAQLVVEHDPQTVGLGISLVSVYWGITALVLGQTIAPRWFVFHQIFYPATWHTRKHRSHISFMRKDRMRRFFNDQPFTVFVRVGQTSIPIVVTASSTVNDIMRVLVQRQIIPANYGGIYTLSYARVGSLQELSTMASLRAGSLSHFHLRACVRGGAPSDVSTSRGSSHSSGSSIVPTSVKQTRPKRRKSDEDVWDWPDAKIIQDSRKSWKSNVYNHYDVSLERCHETRTLIFRFTCRHDPTGHPSLTRARLDTSQGTSNLERARRKCMKDNMAVENGPSGTHQPLLYSYPKHRALIAARCAANKRPFNSVADPYYIQEVEMLRPGTKLPSPTTVSRDIKAMYSIGAEVVREYFSKHNGAVHLVMDGWTSPILACYLGIVAIWFCRGRVHRCILEFARVKGRHTGENLANIAADCVKRYGLEDKLHAVCMDNAGNCNTMVDHLAKLIPSFRGADSRTRCFPHTVNLIAKAFISFFYRQRLKPKTTEPEKPTKRGRGKQPVLDEPVPSGSGDPDIIAASEPTTEELEMCEILENTDPDDVEPIDGDKTAYDKEAVSNVWTAAVAVAKTKFKMELTTDEAQTALGLFPKVVGLARKLHESQPLQVEFEQLASKNNATQCRTLTRRVSTRWNTDFAALKSHVMFEKEVCQLIAAHKSLRPYSLTESQWVLAKHLADVLVIFDEITALFSRADVPLIHEVVPMLIELEERLENIRDATVLPKVIRIAAIAGLLVVEKYAKLSELSEVYRIAMVMCPDKKLAWFDDEQAVTAEMLVRQRWSDTYEKFSQAEELSQPSSSHTEGHSKWLLARRSRPQHSPGHSVDSIDAYLKEPPMSSRDIENAGGVLQYWEKQATTRPHLARMALDFLTAPASSVDAERAFSGGRLQLNYLQHGTSSQTFKAQMAVGSWVGSDIFPTLEPFAQIIEGKSSRSVKGKEKAVKTDTSEDTDYEWNRDISYE